MLCLSGLLILLPPVVLLADEGVPVVKKGDTVELVLKTLGKPKGVVSGGRLSTYYYEQGTVDFVDGRVNKAFLISKDEARERTAQRELAERQHREQLEAGQKRLIEAGKAELARTLEDKAFAARPASERLAYWTEFAKRYPSTDVSAQLAKAAEAGQAEQQDRDREAELVAMNKRVGEIQERFVQLDADYAASLANWKRAEIDAERAKLKDELAAIATRVRTLTSTK
jgi:hypothetical protein